MPQTKIRIFSVCSGLRSGGRLPACTCPTVVRDHILPHILLALGILHKMQGEELFPYSCSTTSRSGLAASRVYRYEKFISRTLFGGIQYVIQSRHEVYEIKTESR